KVRLARIRMAKKGTTNAFLQYKEDHTLGVRDTHSDTHTHSDTLTVFQQGE
ncbi:hypothetical protein XENOCAPTIV_021765, partial [Xenoophorus captivus]